MIRKVLVIMILSFFLFSCGEGDNSDTGTDNENNDIETTDDSGDTRDSGNTGDTGNTGDAADTGNTGNTGNTGMDTEDSQDDSNTEMGDTGNTGNTGNTADDSGDSGDDSDAGNTGDTPVTPEGTTLYTTEIEDGIYAYGFTYTIKVGDDDIDFYVPISDTDKMSTGIYMQGGKVDKGFYSIFAKKLSAFGFVVAIPNHSSMSGANMTENVAFNNAWDFIKTENANNQSPLYDRIDLAKVTVLGHSNGGMAGLGVLQNKCDIPTCMGSYTQPAELSAGVFYGTNTKNPFLGGIGEVDTGNIPTVFVQGDLDGKAEYDDTVATYDKTTGTPVSIVKVIGSNHYGICDMNNPAGAAADNNAPTLEQMTGISVIAKWSGIFMRAHIFDSVEDHTYYYDGQGDTDDTNIEIVSK